MHAGQRVQLGTASGPEGIVTRVERSGRFRVTYDTPERRKGQRRERYWYPADAARMFHYPIVIVGAE
jgi:hypothetical protein